MRERDTHTERERERERERVLKKTIINHIEKRECLPPVNFFYPNEPPTVVSLLILHS